MDPGGGAFAMEWRGDVAERDMGLAVPLLVHGLGTGPALRGHCHRHDDHTHGAQLCTTHGELLVLCNSISCASVVMQIS